ncbi:MAG TPA: GNAT family N-acetyltransferase [Solirubrobacterales bacterium]|nr:GNAT family N-acetyltransferase [Solirubrobacterales bacterium]
MADLGDMARGMKVVADEGRWIATQTSATVEELAARPPDVHKLELEVFDDNTAAIGLYESAGFEREGLRRDHYRREDGSLRSALIMARLFES